MGYYRGDILNLVFNFWIFSLNNFFSSGERFTVVSIEEATEEMRIKREVAIVKNLDIYISNALNL